MKTVEPSEAILSQEPAAKGKLGKAKGRITVDNCCSWKATCQNLQHRTANHTNARMYKNSGSQQWPEKTKVETCWQRRSAQQDET